MKAFLLNHFDSIVTIFITILGFVITYFMTKKNFRDEIQKDKIALASQEIQTLPYDICQLMDGMIKNGAKKQDAFVKEYGAILSKVLAYGSKDAVKVAVKMQQMSYDAAREGKSDHNRLLAAYSLLITQLKYDLTSEVISPESWFQLRITDYTPIQSEMKNQINSIVDEIELSKSFKV